MTRLHDLYTELGQSPWLDNLRRDYLKGGHLASLVQAGVRGLTSNPTIMAKAIAEDGTYDSQIQSLRRADMSAEQIYWELVIDDITEALRIMRAIYDESGGKDGFVSIEVSPDLAYDSEATIRAARSLHDRISAPNLLVKIPATREGLPAIKQMVSEGRSINVTLIFSLERYEEVIEAYISGLEELARSAMPFGLSSVVSVASFFVSRVDTEVDRRLRSLPEASNPPLGLLPARDLFGKAATAQAKLAYELFVKSFSGLRWEKLRRLGANVQRPLWASTSTKNPAYPDLKYVDDLIGPDSVNTMPDATLDAFLDHGKLQRTVDMDLAGARADLKAIASSGVDLSDVAQVLEDEGVSSFAKSFEEVLYLISGKLEQTASTK